MHLGTVTFCRALIRAMAGYNFSAAREQQIKRRSPPFLWVMSLPYTERCRSSQARHESAWPLLWNWLYSDPTLRSIT